MNGSETFREFPLAEGVAIRTDRGSQSFGISCVI